MIDEAALAIAARVGVRQLRLIMVSTIFFTAWFESLATHKQVLLPVIFVGPGLMLASMIMLDRQSRWLGFLAIMLAQYLGLIAGGLSAQASGIAVSLTGGQALIGCLALRRFAPAGLDFTRWHAIVSLGVVALLVAPPSGFLIEAALVSIAPSLVALDPKALADPSSLLWWSSLLRWVLPNALGFVLIVPICQSLLLASRSNVAQWFTNERIAAFAAVAISSIAVFLSGRYAYIFFVAPALVWVAVRLGIRDTAAAVLLSLIIASSSVAQGMGPADVMMIAPEHRAFFLEVAYLCCYACILPVASSFEVRRRLERQLAENLEFSGQILRSLRETAFRTDAAGRWTYLNPAWEQLTGLGVLESIGGDALKILLGENNALTSINYALMISGKRDALSVQRIFAHAKVGMCEVDISMRAMRGPDGSFEGLVGSMRDVSEHRQYIAGLEASERRFRQLCDTSPIGIVRCNPDGTIAYANQRIEMIVLADAASIMEKSWLGVLGVEDPDIAISVERALLIPGAVFEREIAYRDKAGIDRWIAVSAIAEFQDNLKITGYIAAVNDVTQRKQLEHDLVEARRRAEQAAAAKSEFLANLSHEIRTPMNGVIGLADLLAERDLDQMSLNYARLIAESGTVMMQLLNDILDIAKIDAGRLQLCAEPFDLKACLAVSLSLMTASAVRKGLDLKLDIASDVPRNVIGDSLRLRQVIANLIGNAVKFTDAGFVRLGALRDGNDLLVSVEDTGIGIALEHQAMVFQEFVQANSGIAKSHGGTGLGLAISRRIAEAMGGTLTMMSEPGKGSMLHLRIPALPVTDEPAIVADQRSAADALPIHARSLRSLVAEDNRTNQMIICAMLERLGHAVSLAESGEQVLEAVETAVAQGKPFDTVLMDVLMPGMDGLTATRQLRASGHSADALPVIAVTANGYDVDVEKCLAAGMQGHLVKPVRLAALSQVLVKFAGHRDTPRKAPKPMQWRRNGFSLGE